MADIPEWAIARSNELALTESGGAVALYARAFARYIAEHEEVPTNLGVIKTRKVVAENPPAFPSVEEHPSYDMPMHHFGMSLRDYFAGQVVSGMMAYSGDGYGEQALTAKVISGHAYEIADAMLAERAKGGA